MTKWILSLSLLNIADAAATHALVGTGLAEEVNPLMLALLTGGGWPLFWAVKVCVSLGLLCLLGVRLPGWSRWGLAWAVAVYCALMLWHAAIALSHLGI